MLQKEYLTTAYSPQIGYQRPKRERVKEGEKETEDQEIHTGSSKDENAGHNVAAGTI